MGQDDTGFSKKGQEPMNPAAYVSKRKIRIYIVNFRWRNRDINKIQWKVLCFVG